MYEHLPSHIVYVRHPQCLHNIAHDDALRNGIENRRSPLTQLGIQQRDITSEYLKVHFDKFDAVFASTYERTHEIPIAAGLDDSLVIHPLLDERSMGIWHRVPRAKVLSSFPEEEKKLKEMGYYHYSAPEGESCLDVGSRQAQFLSNRRLFLGLKTMLISGHGIAGLCFRQTLLRATVEEWHKWDRLKNASVTVYEKHGKSFKCVLYNHVPWEGLLDDGGGSEA